MKPGPRSIVGATDFVAKAEIAWGADMPDWIRTLAEECSRFNAAAVSTRLDYAKSVISTVISRSYRGDYGRIEEVVRGALMGSVVDCPVLGEIGRDRCLSEQNEPFRATSGMRAQLYHMCAGRCPHSKKHGAEQ